MKFGPVLSTFGWLNCQLLDAGRGHLASLKRLLKYGADPNALAGYDPSRESERERVRVHV